MAETGLMKDYLNRIWSRGNELTDEQRQRAAAQAQTGAGYRQQADAAYDDILAGGGGYTGDEKNRIYGDERLSEMGLTGSEQNDIRGNPWLQMQAFDPAKLEQLQANSEGFQRNSARDLQGGLVNAIGPEDNLRVSGDYTEGTTGAVDDFTNRTRMSDADKAAIEEAAGVTAGAQHAAALDRAERSGRAAGVDPLGMAAYRSRVTRDQAVDAGDAAAAAKIAANREAADREAGIARTKLDQANTGESLRLGAENSLAGKRMAAASEGGQAALQTEKDINAQQRQQQQFNATTGIEALRNVDQTASDRAAKIAGNRQGTQQYVDTQKTARGGAVADARRADEKEARGYKTGMTGMYNQNEQNEYGREGQTFATQAGGSTGMAGNINSATSQPSMWEKIAGIGLGAVSAIEDGAEIKSPSVAVVGEHGPEVVIEEDDPSWKEYLGSAASGFLGGGGLPGALQGVARTLSSAKRTLRVSSPMEYGGSVQDPSQAVVGENGPEAIMQPNGTGTTPPWKKRLGDVSRASMAGYRSGGLYQGLGAAAGSGIRALIGKPTKVALEPGEKVVPLDQTDKSRVRPGSILNYRSWDRNAGAGPVAY